MRFRVFWSPDAESQLEAILAVGDHRVENAKAARDIDGYLMSDPLAFGESRYDDVRIGFVLPLGVEYEVFDDVWTVIVHGVWSTRTRT